jgi:hypothetical protein
LIGHTGRMTEGVHCCDSLSLLAAATTGNANATMPGRSGWCVRASGPQWAKNAATSVRGTDGDRQGESPRSSACYPSLRPASPEKCANSLVVCRLWSAAFKPEQANYTPMRSKPAGGPGGFSDQSPH